MTLTELITTLTKFKHKYGNVEVVCIGVDANTGDEAIMPISPGASFGACAYDADDEEAVDAIYIAPDSQHGAHKDFELYNGGIRVFNTNGDIEY